MSLSALVDTSKSSLFISLASITFNPTAWNIVARNGKPAAPPPSPPQQTDSWTREQEYRNKTITRIFGGNPRLGCYFLTVCIFGAGILRDHLYASPLLSFPYFRVASNRDSAVPSCRYRSALLEQPRVPLLPAPLDTLLPAVLFIAGQTFVVSSTWALGITGTFLGDYFGILMDHRVEGFPFNVLRDPMYVGSTMCFAATALWCVFFFFFCTRDVIG
jgi:phosphatidylethanolamine N-methyltransferase